MISFFFLSALMDDTQTLSRLYALSLMIKISLWKANSDYAVRKVHN